MRVKRGQLIPEAQLRDSTAYAIEPWFSLLLGNFTHLPFVRGLCVIIRVRRWAISGKGGVNLLFARHTEPRLHVSLWCGINVFVRNFGLLVQKSQV